MSTRTQPPEQRLGECCRACEGPLRTRNTIRSFCGPEHVEVECPDCGRHGLVCRDRHGIVTKRRGQVFSPSGDP